MAMLTNWLCIDATRKGELTVCFLGGFDLVIFEGVAELVHRGRFVGIVRVGAA